MEPELRNTLELLTEDAARKRVWLMKAGRSAARLKRLTELVSGILALTSAGAITLVILDFWGHEVTNWVAAIAAALSGVLTLSSSIYLKDHDISEKFVGASKFLELRNRVYNLVIHPQISDKERFRRLTELQSEYKELDERFARHVVFTYGWTPSGMSFPNRLWKRILRDTMETEEAGKIEREELEKALGSKD